MWINFYEYFDIVVDLIFISKGSSWNYVKIRCDCDVIYAL